MITANELRKKYLEFFETKGHAVIPSSSLVPENDPSVLFTMAGMHPLVPYLMGQEHAKGKRVVNCQKCIRTGDIDEVGDATHLTFFEMLGNWSFGDYFKQDAIAWSWEFLTEEKWLHLPKERLAVSVFAGDEDAPYDEESYAKWLDLGVAPKRIAKLPKKNNWWIAGTSGPCGPDSEMFYWIDDGTPAPENFQETESDPRWVEIWNDVFMQFEKKTSGELVPLSQQNVDTGMGLDRTLAVLNGHRSVYDTHLHKKAWEVIGLSQDVLTNDEIKRARIILDHIRAGVFIISDGVEPTNKDRGYVLRRLIRRAMVMARLLNLKHHWIEGVAASYITEYAEAYPELVEKSQHIFDVLKKEEQKFNSTLEKGLKEYEKLVQKNGTITGEDAFNLYQTFGFPWELTYELGIMSGIFSVSEDSADGARGGHAGEASVLGATRAPIIEFQAKFKEHQDLSRTAVAGAFKGGLADHNANTIRLHTTTHLMHKALKEVLGEHVWQKGSNITVERTRFDFTHPAKMTPEEIKAVEEKVNTWIKQDLSVKREFIPLEEARRRGAIGLFGEKYDDVVSVYEMYDKDTGEVVSLEFCGGPHVTHTNLVGGTYKINKEEAVASGIRRIKAVVIPDAPLPDSVESL